ncbi:MAG TPA: sialidase family protein [Thermoanaerobaculia bacterium]|nr:sialidase family protein [Thermoanaerobaculia bacterium]
MRKNIFVFLTLSLLCLSAQSQIVDIANNATDPNNLVDAEPSIAVNPLNNNQIAVVSFSGGWSTATGLRGPVWRSNDGGATWTKQLQLVAPSAASTGSGDQNVVWTKSGVLLFSQLASGVNPPRCFFYRPSGSNFIAGAAYGDDQPMIGSAGSTTVSPWLNFAVSPERSTVERTTNQGVTVTAAAVGSAAFPNRTTRVAVGPNNQIYVIYKTREAAPVGNFQKSIFHVVRSLDFGVTWNTPGATVPPGAVMTWFTTSWGNAKNGGKVGRARSSDAWIAVHPITNAVSVVFCNTDASGRGQIFYSRSTNSGLTFSPPVRVSDGTKNSAYPQVAVTNNGTIGVLYLDFDDSGTQTVYTHRFARSFDNGATWSRVALQSFKTQELSNGVNGFLWGDYEGLTAAGNFFFGVFTGKSIGRAVVQFDPIFFKISG